jgi:predicted Zn-dependent peptidase
MRDYKIHTLANGIRVIHNQITTSKIVHCGIMLDVGSRDETRDNQGIAHFWEHMAFKGTTKRKSFHILNRLEAVGGDLNAFTDKEKVLFYASLRNVYFERAVELLADITFNSVFPAEQIKREQNVILEEMAMYHDDLEDYLQDEFDGIIFKNHPLGMNILGTQKTVSSFKKKDFENFLSEHIDTRRIVFSSVGDVTMEQVIALAEKYLGVIPKLISKKKRISFKGYKPDEVVIKRDIKQARCAIGRPAFKFADEKRSPFYILTNILGGSGMNSRLNLSLREKHGLVYSIAAQYVPFTDTGLFVISFGTEPSQLEKSIVLVRQELKKLRDEPLGKKQFSEAKEQMLGHLAISEENNVSFMMMMARNLLDSGKITSLDEIFDRIKNTTVETLLDLSNEMFNEDTLSYLRIQPN